MYAKRNQIYVGSLDDPSWYFENDQIISCQTVQAVAIVGQELSIDTFNPTVADSEDNLLDIAHFRSSDGEEIRTGEGQVFCLDTEEKAEGSALIDIEDGTPVWYYHERELVGKYYVQAVKRKGRNKYTLECVSAIGRLDKMFHGGGLFTATTFGAVLQHILADGLHGSGTPVIEYAIDDDVANLPVSGWLPYASKRANIYQLIFSNGVNIIKNIDGNPRFTFVYTAPEQADSIETFDIYNGGNVEYTKPYSSVSIMEHTYAAIEDAEPAVLFDNSEGIQVTNEEIWFDQAPVIVSTLQTGGQLTLISATENSAVISGNGTLSGVPYTHSTRMVSRTNSGAQAEKTVSVTDCTMVNLINSENLLERLFAFYCPATHIKQISNEIVYTDQRCGKAYTFKNPYGETETAYLVNIDAAASSVVKAGCEWYANFEPAGQAGLYQHVVILDADTYAEDGGTFEVPDGVEEIKVVIIGGGTGGGSGWPGKNGEEGNAYTEIEQTADLSAFWYGAEGGDGGDGGAGGEPGRVKIIKIENPDASYSYTVGTGGDGGNATDFLPDNETDAATLLNAGTAGTASTFGSYSSADQDAFVPTGGVYDPINDEYFALTGKRGIRGGKGGARQIKSGDTFNWVTDGEDVTGEDGTVYHGGSTGRTMTNISGLPEANGRIKAFGGNGAGAAVGIDRATHPHINGGNDQSTTWEVREDTDEFGGE